MMTDDFGGKFNFAHGTKDFAAAEHATRLKVPKSRSLPGRAVSAVALLGLVFTVTACSTTPQVSRNTAAAVHPMNNFPVPLLVGN